MNIDIERHFERMDDCAVGGPGLAIVVAIAEANELDAIRTATVMWGNMTIDGNNVANGWHGPWPVAEALDRAEELSTTLGVNRVVVSIDHYSDWHFGWGMLLDRSRMH